MYSISIIIPVYNTEKYLNRCLDSIVNQSFNDFEIVVVDDYSNSNCKEIVDVYQKTYKNIKYVRNEVNEGLYKTRIIGINSSSPSKYIMHVDSDDYLINDNVLTELSKEFENDYDIIAFNHICENMNGERWDATLYNKIIYDKVISGVILSLNELFSGSLSESMHSKIIKKELYQNISFEYKHIIFQEDYLVMIKLLYFAQNIRLCVGEYYIYSATLGSSTDFNSMTYENKKKTLHDIVYVYSSVNEFLKQKNLYERFKNEITLREYRYYDWIHNDLFLNIAKEYSNELHDLLSTAFTHVNTYETILDNVCKAKSVKDEIYISIIIPVYNTEKYLNRCLDSIINQAFKDIEIIVVDDFSQGNCKDIVSEYQRLGINIKYIKNPQNMGSAWSRINGLSYARGKYIHFVDSDDWVVEDCYDKINKYLGNKFDVLHFNGCYADDEKSWATHFQIAGSNVIYGKRAAFDDMFFDDKRRRTLWSRVFSRKYVLEGACYMPRQWISVADDWIFNLFILFHVKKYRSIADVFYYYYQDNPNAMTAISEKKANVITGEKLRKATEQYYIACSSIIHFLESKKVWHLYKVNWSLYILRDMKYHLIDPFKFFESSILDINDKDKVLHEIRSLFESKASMSCALDFIRNNNYMSNDLSEKKLWQLARTNWFYKLTSKILRPRMLLHNLFSITDYIDRKCINFFGFKITVKYGIKNV